MVHVLGVELVGVRLELELERTEDEGEATIALGIDSICQGLYFGCLLFSIDM